MLCNEETSTLRYKLRSAKAGVIAINDQKNTAFNQQWIDK